MLAQSVEITQAVLANLFQTVSWTTAGQLLTIPRMNRSIQWTRQRKDAVPPMPKTSVDLVLPKEYSYSYS